MTKDDCGPKCGPSVDHSGLPSCGPLRSHPYKGGPQSTVSEVPSAVQGRTRIKRRAGRPLGSRDRNAPAIRRPFDGLELTRLWRSLCEAFGHRLREVREERDIAVAELAAAVGISRATIHAWEAGRTIPGTKALLAISQALRCSFVDLLPEALHFVGAP